MYFMKSNPGVGVREATQLELICPFCNEDGFDAVGLKAHFYRWCEVFGTIPSPEREGLPRKANEDDQ